MPGLVMNTKWIGKADISDGCNTYTERFSVKFAQREYKVCLNFLKIIDFDQMTSVRQFLHEEENRYFETLQYKLRIKSFLLGRYSAKKAVSALTGQTNFKKIQIKNGVFNQPLVVCETGGNTQVSLSHCEDSAVAAAFHEMLILGVDIEKIGRNTFSGVEAELTQHEKELADSVNCSYESFLLMIWTIKESLSKVLRTGLTIPLSILEIKNIEVHNGYFVSDFTNFFQYHSITFMAGEYIYSMTYPKKAEINLDMNRLKSGLYKMF